jgi:peptidoglycan/LPS O-acetylase OafA/YrhL
MQQPHGAQIQGRILGLDMLRLCAAILVVLDHFGDFGLRQASATVAPASRAFPFLGPMTAIGSIGVEIFFLISGFVITASAAHSTAGRFAEHRFVRVAPALWVSCLIALAARLIAGEPLGGLLVVTAKSAVLSPLGPYIDGVVWTLVVEAVFYILIFCVIRWGAAARLDGLAIALGAVSGLYVMTFFGVSLLAESSARFAHIFAILGRFPFKVLLLRDGVFFSAGMLLWSALRKEAPARRVGLIAVMVALCLVEINIERDTLIDGVIRTSLWLLSLGVLIVSVLKADPIGRWAGRRAGLFRFCGDLSYPLYLNHYTLGMVAVFEIGRLNLGIAATLALSLAFVFTVASLVLLGPEKVIKAWMRSFFRLFDGPLSAPASTRP